MVQKFVILLVLVLSAVIGFVFVRSSFEDRSVDKESSGEKQTTLIDDDAQWNTAMASLANGDENAWTHIEHLSSKNPPFIPAVRFLVDRKMEQGVFRRDVDEFNKLIELLNVLADHGDVQAKFALAQFSSKAKAPDRAISLLRSIAEERPEVQSQLASLLFQQGKTAQAQQTAEKSVAHFQEVLRSEQATPKDYLAIADSLMVLDQQIKGIAFLREGFETFPILQEAFAERVMRYADFLRMQGDNEQALDIVSGALSDLPAHAGLWLRIFEMSQLPEFEGASEADALVEDAARTGSSQGALELVLGAQAYLEGDLKTAIDKLETAVRLSPDSIKARNNLASYLAQDKPPQFDRAIKIANELVNENQGNLRLRETRGQILALAGRDVEAIADLEVAQTVMPDNAPLIETLASLYEKQEKWRKARAVRGGQSIEDQDASDQSRNSAETDGLLREILEPIEPAQSP